jgi:hypothetical protein
LIKLTFLELSPSGSSRFGHSHRQRERGVIPHHRLAAFYSFTLLQTLPSNQFFRSNAYLTHSRFERGDHSPLHNRRITTPKVIGLIAQPDIYGLLRDPLAANLQLAFGLVVVLSVIAFFIEVKFVIRGLKPIGKLIALFNTPE